MKEIVNENSRERGITLIALIITIIILLILVAVTLGVLNGTNLLGNSKKAREAHIIGEEKEAIALSWNSGAVEYSGDVSKITKEDLEKELKNLGKDATVEDDVKNEKPVFKITFNKTGHIYTLDRYGNITGPTNTTPDPTPSKDSSITLDMVASDITSTTITVTVTPSGNGMADNPEYTYYLGGTEKTTISDKTYQYTGLTQGQEYTLKVSTKDKNGNVVEKTIAVTTNKEETSAHEIQVGDTILYTPPSGKSYLSPINHIGSYSPKQLFNSENMFINTWKVWKIDKANNKIEIISESQPSTKLYLKDVQANCFIQGPKIMNEICSELYTDTTLGISARSMDQLDIEEAIAKQQCLKRGTYAWTEYINSLSYYNDYGTTVDVNTSIYIHHKYFCVPNIYNKDDMASTQEGDEDLRPSSSYSCSGTSSTTKTRVTKKNYYCSDKDKILNSLGEIRYNILMPRGTSWLASRCRFI